MAVTFTEYYDSVESIASDALQEYADNEDRAREYIFESVDGSGWIIYYGNNEDVLRHTDNEPDPRDVSELLGDADTGDWQRVRQIAAFLAMEADILERYQALLEEWQEEQAFDYRRSINQ